MTKQKAAVQVDTVTGEVKQKVFRTYYNGHLFPEPRERSIKPSLTVPNQSMSIQEMIDRHRRGLPVRGYSDFDYVDESDPLQGRDIRSLDLEEVKQLRDAMFKKYADARDKWLKEETAKREKERNDAAIAEYLKNNPPKQEEAKP